MPNAYKFGLNKLIKGKVELSNEKDRSIENTAFKWRGWFEPTSDIWGGGQYDTYKKSFRSYFTKIQKIYPQIKIEKKINSLSINFFRDETHLNRNGAKRYTEAIKSKYLKKVYK